MDQEKQITEQKTTASDSTLETLENHAASDSGKKKKQGKDSPVFYLVLGILGVLVAGLMLALGVKTILDQRLDQFDHSDVWDGYAQIDIIVLSDAFAERSDGATMHLAIDKNMSISVVCLTESQEEDLSPVTMDSLATVTDVSSLTPISIQGRHKEIGDSLRHQVVDAYNTMMETDEMTFGMSSRVMGAIYLDCTDQPTTRDPWQYLLLGIAVGLLSLYFLILALVQIHRRRSRSGHTTMEDPLLAEYDVRVGYEVQSKVALTAHAVVDLSDRDAGPVLIPFRRILWIYSSRKKAPFGASRQAIVLALRDGTQKEIALLPTAGAGNQIYLEIFADIRDRVPDALVGYSEENEAEYQKKIRELENSNEPEEDDSMLDRLPEGTGTGNQITGDWQEGEDILPADWDPNAILDNTETSSATSDGTVSASDTVDHKETSDENSSTGDRK